MGMLSDLTDSLSTGFRSLGETVGWDDSEIDAGEVLKGAAAGFIGGLVATLVLDGMQRVMSEPNRRGQQQSNGQRSTRMNRQQPRHPDQGTSNSQKQQHGDEQDQPPERVATIVAEKVAHKRLNAKERAVGGAAVHLGFGTFVGTLYGAAAEAAPVVTIGGGTAYGAAVWALADETAVPLMGLAKPPKQRALSEHTTSFVGHLVYGSVLELVRRGVRTLI
jgi:uncharacterized membrane protein YagU involved in acid resistance